MAAMSALAASFTRFVALPLADDVKVCLLLLFVCVHTPPPFHALKCRENALTAP